MFPSSKKSSKAPLMKPESCSPGNGGRTGLVGSEPIRGIIGGDDGILAGELEMLTGRVSSGESIAVSASGNG